MTVIGFHASHEQIGPGQLLADVQRAEQAGFTAAMCSDHFAPWSERQGHSGFSFAWLGAAMATTELPFGVVVAPGQRYHPAIVAQAIATLGEMFPGRFWAALGSGENVNEHITGEAWPSKEVRQARLEESVDVIRRLLDGEEVSREGLVTVDRAVLWTRPDVRPLLIGPAVSVATARRAAAWADGLITINQPIDHLRHMVEAYRGAGGRGRLAIQVHLSWAPTEAEAVELAMDQWRTNVFSPPVPWDLDTPQAFDEVSADVTEATVRESVIISSDTAELVERLRELIAVGFDEVYLHHVGQEQAAFIDTFGEKVLPELGVTRPEVPAR